METERDGIRGKDCRQNQQHQRKWQRCVDRAVEADFCAAEIKYTSGIIPVPDVFLYLALVLLLSFIGVALLYYISLWNFYKH